MVLILAIVWAPRWFHTYGIFFLRRSQYVGCTQYMATRTAILDGKIVLNQCLEEIAKREAPFRGSDTGRLRPERQAKDAAAQRPDFAELSDAARQHALERYPQKLG